MPQLRSLLPALPERDPNPPALPARDQSKPLSPVEQIMAILSGAAGIPSTGADPEWDRWQAPGELMTMLPIMAGIRAIREPGKVSAALRSFYEKMPTEYQRRIRSWTSPDMDRRGLAGAVEWLKQHPEQRAVLNQEWTKQGLPEEFLVYRGTGDLPNPRSFQDLRAFSTEPRVGLMFAGKPGQDQWTRSPALQVGESRIQDVLAPGFPQEQEVILNPSSLGNLRVHSLTNAPPTELMQTLQALQKSLPIPRPNENRVDFHFRARDWKRQAQQQIPAEYLTHLDPDSPVWRFDSALDMALRDLQRRQRLRSPRNPTALRALTSGQEPSLAGDVKKLIQKLGILP